MQTNILSSRDNGPRITIDDISAPDFADLCWEAHPRARWELCQYLSAMVESGCGALFAAYSSQGEVVGRVAVEIHPAYTSRGFPCATFGWLDGENECVISLLLEVAGEWAAKQQVVRNGRPRRNALLRGPISFPKELGGVGCQVEGFGLPRMYVISTNQASLGGWINQAGFAADATYACVDVSQTPAWESSLPPSEDFTLATLSRVEWLERKEEIQALCASAFSTFLPDTVSYGRFEALHAATVALGDVYYSWPAAFDHDGHLTGVIVCLPNLYEAWDNRPVAGVNVDTVVIAPSQRGKGLFSALHDKGYRDQQQYCGITYFEGTAIWEANENAVNSIFPHGTICRRHVVFQKRLKKT